MNLELAKSEAIKLSRKNWNQYFHIWSNDDKEFHITKYHHAKATLYAFKGVLYFHNIKKTR